MSMPHNLTNALFTKIQQRVLGLLFIKHHSSFNTNEIIRFSQCGRGAVQRELKSLSESGLIFITPIGNQKHYQANPQSPIFQELRNIILKTFGLASIIREALASVQSKIIAAFIFGSIAKNEDTAKSDIDIMIISNKITYADLFSLLQKAEATIDRPIHPQCYSLAEWRKKIKNRNHFLMRVIQQPKIFLIGSENEFGKLSENRSPEKRTKKRR